MSFGSKGVGDDYIIMRARDGYNFSYCNETNATMQIYNNNFLNVTDGTHGWNASGVINLSGMSGSVNITNQYFGNYYSDHTCTNDGDDGCTASLNVTNSTPSFIDPRPQVYENAWIPIIVNNFPTINKIYYTAQNITYGFNVSHFANTIRCGLFVNSAWKESKNFTFPFTNPLNFTTISYSSTPANYSWRVGCRYA